VIRKNEIELQKNKSDLEDGLATLYEAQKKR